MPCIHVLSNNLKAYCYVKNIEIVPYGQVGKKDFVLVAEEKNNIKCHQIRYDNLATLNVLYILEKKLKI